MKFQLVAEAKDILDRALDRLSALLPSTNPGDDFFTAWRGIIDIRENWEKYFGDGTFGSVFFSAIDAARKAGIKFEDFCILCASVVAEVPETTVGKSVRNLISRMYIAQIAMITSTTQYASRDDVDVALKSFNALAVPIEEEVADDDDVSVYRAFIALRAGTVRDLVDRGRLLPRIINFEFGEVKPGLWIAQRLYADAGRFEELLSENKWVHPAFPPKEVRGLSV